MTTNLAILIPVLRRPQNIEPLVESIINNTTTDFEILFMASPSDFKEIKELQNQNQPFMIMDADYENRGDYARKINQGFNSIEAEWYFLAADDIRFHSGWFEAAMDIYTTTGASVIGTNDLGNPFVLRGEHSTHTLVRRNYVLEYGTVDEPGKVLHESYPHEWVDTEFVETAKARREWAFARESKVEHFHPNWKKAPTDSLYEGQNKRMYIGRYIYESRRKLWV